MNDRVALLIIYNHRYDKNISRLEEIYKEKFQYRFHVVPFYDGSINIDGLGGVIPVVGHSWYFQGYICQAYQYLKIKYGKHFFTHYFVVADDMLINPSIDEHNIWDIMGIDKCDVFFPEVLELQSLKFSWRIHQALDYKRKLPGVEIVNELPSVEDAKKKFDQHQIKYGKIPISSIFSFSFPHKKQMLLNIITNHQWKYLFKSRTLDYPLVGGYSDIFLITDSVVEKFIHYCGAFASSGLFVEIAIPTSLILACDNIKYFSDIALNNGAIWFTKERNVLNKYNFKLDKLIKDFPKDVLFLHPIKLSKWK